MTTPARVFIFVLLPAASLACVPAGPGDTSSTGGANAGTGGKTMSSGGSPGSGGAGSGGMTTSTGGAVASGGLSGGGAGMSGGGGTSTGGAALGGAATGGRTATGGMPGAGGTSGSGGTAGAGGTPNGGTPGTFKVFDRIPQFGMYATSDPVFTPPAGVLMWNVGTIFVAKLSAAQQSQIGSDLAARITYHAQCDNYDRLGSVFFIAKPAGQAPKPADGRIELVRFITPFSNYNRGALATNVYPNADISAYARTLADPTRDVWIGIGGGSNPYDGDPCTNAGVAPDFRSIGFRYSLELVSTKALGAGAGGALSAVASVAATSVPVAGSFENTSGAAIAGQVIVIVSGHGSAAGGHEYRNTQDTVTLNGTQIGSFGTQVDCASYERTSPDGNPGIFRNNNSSNPRNWCPGALVPSRRFPASLMPGRNTVSLGINAAPVPSGSYYSTSISFTFP
jgi:hypothetical protein